MKKIYLLSTAAAVCMTVLSCLAACSDDKDPQPPIDPGFPPIEVDRSNMYGVAAFATVNDGNIGGVCDPGVTPEIVTDMVGAMGFKSFRMLLHLSWVLEWNDDGELVFNKDNLQRFKDYVAMAYAKGVKNVMLINAAYMVPFQYPRTHWLAIPDIGTEEYIEFLEMLEESYRMLAAEFPDITYFEVGNEINAPNGHNMCKNGFDGNATVEENAPYIFTTGELALITADICYYANRGIKAANPKAMVVKPGLYMVDIPETKAYLNDIYEHILSGNLPTSRDYSTGQRKLPADTDIDNYFEYLNWHPYIHEGSSKEWLDMNRSLYRIAVDHGDSRKVLITEFGYFDSYLERREELIADVCADAIDALVEALPAIEAVFIFQMFNWTTAPNTIAEAEQTFGIFDSPLQERGIRPKPVAINLFYHINGYNADSDPLFRYMK